MRRLLEIQPAMMRFWSHFIGLLEVWQSKPSQFTTLRECPSTMQTWNCCIPLLPAPPATCPPAARTAKVLRVPLNEQRQRETLLQLVVDFATPKPLSKRFNVQLCGQFVELTTSQQSVS